MSKAFLNARKIETYSSVYQPTTRDYDLVPECVNYCMKNHRDCSNLCMDDVECVHNCNVQLSGCLNLCPCQAGCPSGCEGKTVVSEMKSLRKWSFLICFFEVVTHPFVTVVTAKIAWTILSARKGFTESNQGRYRVYRTYAHEIL